MGFLLTATVGLDIDEIGLLSGRVELINLEINTNQLTLSDTKFRTPNFSYFKNTASWYQIEED